MSLSNKIHKFASYSLILLFVMMQLVQAVHMHFGESHSNAAALQTGKSKKHIITKQISKCHICDFNHHRQQDLAPDLKPFSLICLGVKRAPARFGYVQSIFTLSVHTWTNKGPPSSFAV